MSLPDYRLLVDFEVIEFLQKKPKRTREKLFLRCQEIAAKPGGFYDYTEPDSVGRDLGVHVFGDFAIKFWEDSADGHLKILAVRPADY